MRVLATKKHAVSTEFASMAAYANRNRMSSPNRFQSEFSGVAASAEFNNVGGVIVNAVH